MMYWKLKHWTCAKCHVSPSNSLVYVQLEQRGLQTDITTHRATLLKWLKLIISEAFYSCLQSCALKI